ncbi:MAG: SpoIIE family protein phosphatase [bacterium]|nr:SpoIIE family protein phosphatase [bacterium]
MRNPSAKFSAFRGLYLVLLAVTMTSFACNRGEQLAPGDASIERTTEVVSGWEYRFEEDAGATKAGEADSGASGWRPFAGDAIRPFSNRGRILYIRHATLAAPDCSDPALYFPLVHQSFEARAPGGDKLLYRFGDPDLGAAGYRGWPFHLISLGESPGIELKIYSDYAQIGVAGSPMIGCRSEIVEDLLREDIDRFVLATIAITTGIFVLILYIRRRLELIYFSFGLLAFDAGLYLLSNRTLRLQYILWPAHMVWMYVEYISLYTLPLCLGFYFRQVVSDSRVIRYTVNGMVLFVAGLFAVHLAGVPIYKTIFTFFEVSLVATLLLLFPLMRAVFRGNSEARLIAAGVLAFLLVALYDLSGVLGLIPWPRQLISYGFAVLLSFLALVVSRRYEEVRSRLHDYSRELESARNQLAAHATNLEEVVARRTGRLKRNLERVRWLKRQQDGDYFLIARLMAPFAPRPNVESEALHGNRLQALQRNRIEELRTETITVQSYVDQKKKFRFKHWREEIGGDISMAAKLRLGDSDCVVCVNADAMGKSIQGAGGAIVLSVAYQAMIERERNRRRITDALEKGDASAADGVDLNIVDPGIGRDPRSWLKECFLELHRTFLPFEGGMLVTAWMAVLVEGTGELFWINAEHPGSVLLRDGKAEFLPETGSTGKLGVVGSEDDFTVERLQLQPGDVIVSGSDGRDDILVPAPASGGETARVMNEDEFRFVRLVAELEGDLAAIGVALRQGDSELTDDLSLLSLRYG